jgi:hypothetical protein
MAAKEVPLVHHSQLLSHGLDQVKQELVGTFEEHIGRILGNGGYGPSNRKLEQDVWGVVTEIGQLLMGTALSVACAQTTESDIEARGLTAQQWRLRNDKNSYRTMTTTFGPVEFFTFAYRDVSNDALSVTRTPAREQIFPMLSSCHSSELTLEWEAKLGQEMPFRRAQKALSFFTHGALSLEDTTIESHMLTLSRLVDRQWLYQTPETIAEVLQHQATRDLKTGQPLVYLSTDAHALRQFVDETWEARWKMANGLRLWCVDRHNGAIIHLGGEYTWGDCHRVGEIVDWLINTGRVPADGNYGDGLVATVVLPTDGMPWITDYVIAKFSTDAVAILDAHHAVKHLRDYAAARFGGNSPEAKEFCRHAFWLLFGRPLPMKSKASKRRTGAGSRKNKTEKRPRSTRRILAWQAYELAPSSVEVLIGQLLRDDNVPPEATDTYFNLIDYLENNAHRMDYLVYRSQGYQIGSGAMESLHRSGSQIRLKLPGLKSLPETSQAIFNLRMMDLCGRWDEFFQQDDLPRQLLSAFNPSRADDNQASVTTLKTTSGKQEETMARAA